MPSLFHSHPSLLELGVFQGSCCSHYIWYIFVVQSRPVCCWALSSILDLCPQVDSGNPLPGCGGKKRNLQKLPYVPFCRLKGKKIIPTGQPLIYCEPHLWKEYDKLILVSQFSNCWWGMPSPLPPANQDLYQNGLGCFFRLYHLHSLVRPCALHKGASWSHQKYSNMNMRPRITA